MSDEIIVKKAADRGIKLLEGCNSPAPENAVAQSSAIQLLAEQHGREVIEILLDIAINGEPDTARVAACKELLARGFCKVPQADGSTGPGVTIVNVVTGVRGRER
jgi:hypothetical protein